MCNVNPNNFQSETEYLQAVHGIQPVIANPMQTFQCGKCGIHNVIAMPLIQPMQRNPIQYEIRENCRVSQSQIHADLHRQDLSTQMQSSTESWSSGYREGYRTGRLHENSRNDGMGLGGFIIAVIGGAIVILTLIFFLAVIAMAV